MRVAVFTRAALGRARGDDQGGHERCSGRAACTRRCRRQGEEESREGQGISIIGASNRMKSVYGLQLYLVLFF